MVVDLVFSPSVTSVMVAALAVLAVSMETSLVEAVVAVLT